MSEDIVDYYIVPSNVVAKQVRYSKAKKTGSEWYSLYLEDAASYKNQWDVFFE